MPQDDYEPQPIDPGSLPANTYAHGISYPAHESMAADSIPADGLSDANLSSDVPSLSITLSGIDDFTAFESYSQSVLAQFAETMAPSGGVQTPAGFLGAVGAIANASIVDIHTEVNTAARLAIELTNEIIKLVEKNDKE